MKGSINKIQRGSAVVASMLIALLILGSLLMLQTAAIVSIGNTSRALEIANQNAVTATRLERATREAAQRVFGIGLAPSQQTFGAELSQLVKIAPTGELEIDSPKISAAPQVPVSFPSWTAAPAVLTKPSDALDLISTPSLRAVMGERIAESPVIQVSYDFHRKALASNEDYPVVIECRLVSVPLSRFGLTLYDLPNEIGTNVEARTSWPESISSGRMAPRGLVAPRDPANIADLSSGSARPDHYRAAAVLSEAYEYFFSQAYIQQVADFAGPTHFVQIGAAAANPRWSGGTEKGNHYTLDLGQFGDGALGADTATKSCAVLCAVGAGAQLVLRDNGTKTDPVFLLIVGPASSNLGVLNIQFASSISRPIVILGYHVELHADSPVTVNGAILLDKDSVVSPTVGPVSVGHLSCWAGGNVSPEAFRLVAMPASAEDLAPRVLYAVTNQVQF